MKGLLSEPSSRSSMTALSYPYLILLLSSSLLLSILLSFTPLNALSLFPFSRPSQLLPSQHAAWEHSLDKCRKLHVLPGPASDFGARKESDRFVEGTPMVLIRNATVWTGEDNGHELLTGMDVVLARGIIHSLGRKIELETLDKDTVVVEAHGAWLTPGIFDMHSHIGVDAAPALSGASDTNSIQKPVLPFLRSLDGINTHDASFKRSVSGGVTTSLVLPGSANNVGGQAFVIKLRGTKERTPESLVLEMPYNVLTHGKSWPKGDPPRWRHMKMACGENIRRVYKQTRLDLSYNFRSSFEMARKIKVSQDEYCERALESDKKGATMSEKFPDDLEWEALVDVLRGKVLVNTHCYESTDFSAFIRHTNEFQFPIAAFHHAHEAFTVPDLLKSAWNSTPAVAIFATNARYKREAWRGSEYAAKILAENNITVIMKSDHPVLDSRYLLFEAQQAHHFGLAENLALASITTSSSRTAGFGHRLGYVRKSYDADMVLWDSHPLALGATPIQVFIDGIAQLDSAFAAKPLSTSIVAPSIASVPEFPMTLQDDDDSLRTEVPTVSFDEVVFTNVSEVLVKKKGSIASLGADIVAPFTVHIRKGEIICIGPCASALSSSSAHSIDLQGGSILPPLIAFGPALGLTDIIAEKSTSDNAVFDPLYSGELSRVQQIWGTSVAVKAIDGISFGGKHLRVSAAAGVMKAVTAPMGDGFFRGVSVAFRTTAANILESGAIIKEAVALHVTIGHYKGTQMPSISTEIAELRSLLLSGLFATESPRTNAYAPQDYFSMAATGKIPLVVNAWKADVMATLILLKKEVEAAGATNLRWVIHGGQESHLIATELAAANIAVILSPPRAFPESWDERRANPGPPLRERNAANILHNAGVLLSLGVPEEWQSRTLLWEAAWAMKTAHGEVSHVEAISWLSTNLEQALGIDEDAGLEFVAWERDPWEFGSRAVAASKAGAVELLRE